MCVCVCVYVCVCLCVLTLQIPPFHFECTSCWHLHCTPTLQRGGRFQVHRSQVRGGVCRGGTRTTRSNLVLLRQVHRLQFVGGFVVGGPERNVATDSCYTPLPCAHSRSKITFQLIKFLWVGYD